MTGPKIEIFVDGVKTFSAELDQDSARIAQLLYPIKQGDTITAEHKQLFGPIMRMDTPGSENLANTIMENLMRRFEIEFPDPNKPKQPEPEGDARNQTDWVDPTPTEQT